MEFGMPSPTLVGLTQEPIDTPALLEFVTTPQAGAVVLFLGTVREMTNGKTTVALDYEAYPEMAFTQMDALLEEAFSRWPIVKGAIMHRLGHLGLGECSVAIAVSSPHRGDAFAAGQFLIDEFKVRVPVWKKENWSDGTTEWIHPGLDAR